MGWAQPKFRTPLHLLGTSFALENPSPKNGNQSWPTLNLNSKINTNDARTENCIFSKWTFFTALVILQINHHQCSLLLILRQDFWNCWKEARTCLLFTPQCWNWMETIWCMHIFADFLDVSKYRGEKHEQQEQGGELLVLLLLGREFGFFGIVDFIRCYY